MSPRPPDYNLTADKVRHALDQQAHLTQLAVDAAAAAQAETAEKAAALDFAEQYAAERAARYRREIAILRGQITQLRAEAATARQQASPTRHRPPRNATVTLDRHDLGAALVTIELDETTETWAFDINGDHDLTITFTS